MQVDPPKAMFFTLLHQHPKWEAEIQKELIQLAEQKELEGNDAINLLLKFRERYCFKREQPKLPRWKKEKVVDLGTLTKLYHLELGALIKGLSLFLLEYKPKEIPILLSKDSVIRQYSKKQLFYLVVLMFMGLIPQQPYDIHQFKGRFSSNNDFGEVLSYSEFKTKCIVEYLKDTLSIFQKEEKCEEFIIYRSNSDRNLFKLLQEQGHKPLTNMVVEKDTASIEDFDGQAKVDFANRFIGGGCLRGGCVQEEIMFAIRPELYTATLLCQKMESNQALAFKGFRYYFKYQGYARKTTYAGKAEHPSKPILQNGSLVYNENIVAIDAFKFKEGDYIQYSEKDINRQLLKAYTGFSFFGKEVKIVTGGWGCGVYNGDFITKTIIQWIAASITGKDIVICPFGRRKSLKETHFVQTLRNLTVRELYDLLVAAGAEKQKNKVKDSIFEMIVGRIKKS